MANEKISQLASSSAQTGDEIPIARSGANYKVTASSIAALAGGGVQNIVSLPLFTGGAGNLASLTIVLRIPASRVLTNASALRVGLSFYAITNVVLTGASIGATLPNPSGGVAGFVYDYAWTTSPTGITWPGGSFINNSEVYYSNPVSIDVDVLHDYWITIHLDSSNAANSPYTNVGSDPFQENCGGYLSGDHTNDSDASALATAANLQLIGNVISA